jgi:hypothetical protein
MEFDDLANRVAGRSEVVTIRGGDDRQLDSHQQLRAPARKAGALVRARMSPVKERSAV